MFERFTSTGVVWGDGTEAPVDTAIVATGYRPNLDYLPAEAFGHDGWPVNRRGVSTTVPNLAYVGLPGQHGTASATLRGVGPDAAHVTRSIAARLAATTPEATEPRAAVVGLRTADG
jgi:putative flavoprotein involved in K+ transport